jgi:ubiquinone/menaquinone biosynthesis C-methylase UbiE
MKKKWSGERLESFVYNRDTIDHLHRYAIVSKYIKGKIVLDIASGEGYGTNLISQNAKFVYGVDIDSQSILEAKQKYQEKNLEFIIGSTNEIPILNESVDVVVSFETIEHHDKHEEMMMEIKRVLKPDGLLILSTPDKLHYSDKRNFKNKFHIKELYKSEFQELVSKHFKEVQLLNQMFINGNSIINDDLYSIKTDIYSGDFSSIYAIEYDPTYLISISSNIKFIPQPLSIFNGNMIIKGQEKKIANNIYNSNTYKVGNLILMPFKYLKRLLK